MTSESLALSPEEEFKKLEEEFRRFNIEQVNHYIRFYNSYGHKLYLLEKNGYIDESDIRITDIPDDGRLIVESMEEIEYVREQFRRLCEDNEATILKHAEDARKKEAENKRPAVSMIELLKILILLGSENNATNAT